jgi:uncharacterized membrane protein YqjE
MTYRDGSRRQSIFGLGRELVGGLIGLARLEVTHGRQEMGQSFGHVKGAVILFAIAAGLALFALITLLVFVILALAALTGWPGWVWALIVFLVLAISAGLLAYAGVRQAQQVKPKPDETIASVKEDIAWAKRLIRRE